MNFNVEDYKQYQLVDFYSINQYPGWTALGTVDESYWNTLYTNGQSNSVECKKAKMLIGLRDESPAHKLNEEFKASQQELSKKITNIKELEDLLKKKDAKIYDLNFDVKSKSESLDTLNAKVVPLRDQLYKMEADLGKVRKAIGDLQFNNIVGEKK